MTVPADSDGGNSLQVDLPFYRDKTLLHDAADEYEKELRHYGLLKPDETLPSNVREGKTDQSTVQGRSKQLWERLELARQRGREIEGNRRTLLYPNHTFNLLPNENWLAEPDRAAQPQMRLSLDPHALDAERKALQETLSRAYPPSSHNLPMAAELLNPHYDWPTAEAAYCGELRQRQHALLLRALTLATATELISLGAWTPAGPQEKPPTDRRELLMALAQSCRPDERPQCSRLLSELWNDFELVRMIDRMACEGFRTWEFFPWWVWERDPQATQPQRAQANKVDPRRKQRVSDVVDYLVGVVIRNARDWAAAMETSWRGKIVAQALGKSIKEIQQEKNRLGICQTASSLTSCHATADEPEQDVLSQAPARGAVRVADSVWWKAQRALLADLKVDEHNVIALRYFSSRNHREIARAEVARLLKITSSQVEKLEKSAKAKMREAATRLRIDAPQND